ncbi:hypothetical protein [Sphingomonas sp. BK345]|uniref:hypothetical protein n=1 Tax=Sphingomonas sp. BK345 TaxID=2586980 RepID=UPI00161E80AF|nr:hypothetical protein [Sphingomonas sp. BK345]MBB3475584.1 hypothetical protein [Sphingomonas sp. BK345]
MKADPPKWTDKVSAAATVFSVFVSVAALGVAFFGWRTSDQQAAIAREQIKLARETLIVQVRVEALRRYNEAYAQLDSAFQSSSAATGQVGIDLEEPSVISSLSLLDARKVASVTQVNIAALRTYVGQINGSRGLWSSDTDEKIAHAGSDAVEAFGCFGATASPPIGKEELLIKRSELLKKCSHLAAKWRNFTDASNAAVNAMSAETRSSIQGTGAVIDF